MTVRQLVNTFGLKAVSDSVRDKWKNGKKEGAVKVCWAIERNPDFRPGAIDPKLKRWRSTYWEKGKSENGLLSISGVNMFNVICPRWETDNNDPYGSGPGTDAVPTFKGLSLAEKQYQLAREFGVKPTWLLNPELKSQQKLFVPGGHIYSTSKDSAVPAFDPNLDTVTTRNTIIDYQDRINRFFFVDLFLMVANEDRSNVTATEIQAKQQERMMALGPVLQALNDEEFDVLIDLVYDAMERRGMIPEPPPELDGVKLRIEYISILAQAQKASDVTALDRFVGSIFNLAGGDPADQVMDLLPKDEVARRYHDLLGQHPDVIASEEEVDETRTARQQQLQQEQQLASAQSLATVGKTLSDTSLEGNNALQEVLSGGDV